MTMTMSAVVAERIAHILDRFAAPEATPSERVALPPSPEAAIMYLKRAPQVTWQNYIRRLIDYMYCSPECFVIAAILTIRLVSRGILSLNPLTTHRVYGACLVLAVKSRDDQYYHMSYYAQVLGVPRADLNMMELFALKALDFRTHVQPVEYALMVDAMVEVDVCGGDAWQEALVRVVR